jgi:hypothetical protein
VRESLSEKGFATSFFEPLPSMPLKGDFALSTLSYALSTLLLNSRIGSWDYLFINKAYPNALIPALVTKIRGGRVILDIDDADSGFHSGVMSGVVELCQMPLPHIADYLCTHSETIGSELRRKFPEKPVLFLGQGVNPKLLAETPGAAGIRREYCGDAEIVVLYTAHMNVASEFPLILDIFSKASSDTNAVLLAPGGGPRLHEFRSLARASGLGSRVVMPGSFSREQLAAYNHAADVCLVYYPDSHANRARVSMKVREHLAAGRITVCNRVGDLASMAGMAVQGGDSISEMAETLASVIRGISDIKSSRPVINGCSGLNVSGKAALPPDMAQADRAAELFGWSSIVADFLRQLGKHENRILPGT